MRILCLLMLLVTVSGILGAPTDPVDENLDTIDGPTTACSSAKVDVLFIVDASSSISVEKFDSMRSFIVEIMKTEFEKLGRDAAQVGLVMFSDDVVTSIPFNKYYKTEEFNAALTNLTYVRGETNLGKALVFVRTKVMKPANGLRPTVPHVVILLTDGWATDGVLTRAEMRRLQATGAHVLAVGIGEQVDKFGLKAMVNSSDDVMLVQTFKGLASKVPVLREKSCTKIQKIQRCQKSFKANVIFVVDSSSSIGPSNFKKLKAFLVSVTRAFKVIGKEGIQVAMLQFSSYHRTKVVFKLEKYEDRTNLEAAINKLTWTKGSTKTGYALRIAYRKIARRAKRKNVNSTFIVITDGKATDRVEREAKRLHKLNYTVLAVGIGKADMIDENELRAIASEPKDVHVFHPEDFSELPNFLQYVVTGVCHQVIVESKQQKDEKEAEKQAD